MKTRNVLIVVIGLIIVAILFSSTPEPEVLSPKADPTPVPVQIDGTRIEGSLFRNTYMESCTSFAVTEDYCDCTYGWLQENVSLEKLMDTADEDMEELLLPAIADCMRFLEIPSDL